MPVVTRYADVLKNDEGGTPQTFTALRAVGLAVEEGHRYCKAHGFGRLSQEAVTRVHLSGKSLRVRQGVRWRKVPSCTLQLADQEASFVLAVVEKHRAFFNDLGLNVWEVDLRIPNRLGYYDLLGDFSTRKNFGVLGQLWIEIKVIFGCPVRIENSL